MDEVSFDHTTSSNSLTKSSKTFESSHSKIRSTRKNQMNSESICSSNQLMNSLNALPIHSYESLPSNIEQTSKSEMKTTCFLETPPPSLPDIHLTQDSSELSSLDKQSCQQLKSKRKQDRPQRKSLPSNVVKQQNNQDKQINGVLNHFLLKEKHDEDLSKRSIDLADPGYLSDEYVEPTISNRDHFISLDLERFYQRLEKIDDLTNISSNSIDFHNDENIFYQQFQSYLSNNHEHYLKLDQYRSEYYNDENNPRIRLISNILKRLFTIGLNKNLIIILDSIPDEIKSHLKRCFDNVQNENLSKQKKIHTRVKRLTSIGQKTRSIQRKRISTNTEKISSSLSTNSILNSNEIIFPNEQQMLLSPSSPLTPISNKVFEQQTNEELLSPNINSNQQINHIQDLPILPKERDIYEIIHCLCQYQIDNGFMIQVNNFRNKFQ